MDAPTDCLSTAASDVAAALAGIGDPRVTAGCCLALRAGFSNATAGNAFVYLVLQHLTAYEADASATYRRWANGA